MIISNIKLKNWRNFKRVKVDLQKRQFLVGPNASGKSNFLDAFRFLYDIAKKRGGGLQEAIEKRGGMSKVRCLSARRDPEVVIDITLSDTSNGNDSGAKWRYQLGIKQEERGLHQPYVSRESVWSAASNPILERPTKADKKDPERRKQTHLEQINENSGFRAIADYLDKIAYMHLVPQLLRHSEGIQGKTLEDDPFGQGFLETIAKTSKANRESRFKRINEVIQKAVPQLKEIRFEPDKNTGKPHIAALCSHWRANAGWQLENQFSDGTLRLIALIWFLLDSDSLLLLEEPELSLHKGIVEHLAVLLYRAQKRKNRQVLISTHSDDLLSDRGIGAEEVLLLTPTDEGTSIEAAVKKKDIRALLALDVPIGEAVMSRTRPANSAGLTDTLL